MEERIPQRIEYLVVELHYCYHHVYQNCRAEILPVKTVDARPGKTNEQGALICGAPHILESFRADFEQP
jgi:hypothetical protein